MDTRTDGPAGAAADDAADSDGDGDVAPDQDVRLAALGKYLPFLDADAIDILNSLPAGAPRQPGPTFECRGEETWRTPIPSSFSNPQSTLSSPRPLWRPMSSRPLHFCVKVSPT